MSKYNATLSDRHFARLYLSLGYKYLARDKDGKIFLYYYKPNKMTKVWWSETGKAFIIGIGNNCFKFVKWEDDEPTPIDKIVEVSK